MLNDRIDDDAGRGDGPRVSAGGVSSLYDELSIERTREALRSLTEQWSDTTRLAAVSAQMARALEDAAAAMIHIARELVPAGGPACEGLIRHATALVALAARLEQAADTIAD